MERANQSVDTLRGLACILLVLFHIIGSTAAHGLRIEAGLLRELNDLLAYIRMPLFTFLSGVVYCYRPFTVDNTKAFLSGKVMRLLLPMLTVGTAFAVLQSLTPSNNGGDIIWWQLHLYPVAHYWFIESLFIIFVVMVLCELLGLTKSPLGLIAILSLAVAGFLSGIEIPLFSISGALYLFPFFLLGTLSYRFTRQVNKYLGVALVSLAVVALVCVAIELWPLQPKRSLDGLVIGAIFCVGLYICAPQQKWLARTGHYSYAIYLFHVFFTAATRILLHKLGITDLTAVVTLSLITGLLGPIVCEMVIKHSAVLRTLLLGKRWVGSGVRAAVRT